MHEVISSRTLPSAAAPSSVNLPRDTLINGGETNVQAKNKKPFNFNDKGEGDERGYLKLLLLSNVRENGAHRVSRGELDKKFESVLEDFIKNCPRRLWTYMNKPTVKTLRDNFRALLRDRRSVVASNTKSSGIVENISNIDVMTDDIIMEKDEFEEGKRRKHEECDAKKEQLSRAGNDIRQRAVGGINLIARAKPDVLTADSSIPSKRVRYTNEGEIESWQATIVNELRLRKEAQQREATLRSEELQMQSDRWAEEKTMERLTESSDGSKRMQT